MNKYNALLQFTIAILLALCCAIGKFGYDEIKEMSCRLRALEQEVAKLTTRLDYKPGSLDVSLSKNRPFLASFWTCQESQESIR